MTSMREHYAICTVKPWNIAAYKRRSPDLPGEWYLIEKPDQLTLLAIQKITPRYGVFPHWSWRVAPEITERFECVCFHMSDVPYGRGGSPLQNLIARGHKSTMLTALRMVDEIDAGPVYLKRPLSLEGRAVEIYERAADLVYDMMQEIITNEMTPVPQKGEVTIFPRRKPEQSSIPQTGSAEALYDFIRMLDAPTYPRAFIDWGQWRLEFDQARMLGDGVEAHVTIRKMNGRG